MQRKGPLAKAHLAIGNKETVKIEIKPGIRDLSIKSNSKYINRSSSSRNIQGLQSSTQHEVTSKLEKSFKKIIKYPSKNNDKIKELKRENKRLKKLLEDTEQKYNLYEKYIQLFFTPNDLKNLKKVIGQKLSLLDFNKDRLFKFEKAGKSKVKSPCKFQVEKIYMPQNTLKQHNNWFAGSNLLERSGKKTSRNKISYSASMRRLDQSSKNPLGKCGCNGVLDYLHHMRREPEMSTNANTLNENTLQFMLKSYKDKEKKWGQEKRKLQNEVS